MRRKAQSRDLFIVLSFLAVGLTLFWGWQKLEFHRGTVAFFELASGGDLHGLREKWAESAPPEDIWNSPFNPLVGAVLEGRVDVVKYLLAEREAPVVKVTSDGKTDVFLYAARSGRPEIAALLLDHGSDVSAVEPGTGTTSLMWAARKGDAEMVDFLLAHGADPSLKDRRGRSAAGYARQAGHRAIAKRIARADKT